MFVLKINDLQKMERYMFLFERSLSKANPTGV